MAAVEEAGHRAQKQIIHSHFDVVENGDRNG